MAAIPLNDAMFFLVESQSHPAHVIALQLFKPPSDADSDFMHELARDLRMLDEVKPVFRRHPRESHLLPALPFWVEEEDLDLDYHIRRYALPTPGRVRELFELLSTQHSVLLDRNRPLWEYHLVEGLSDGRFATAFKSHHALADGMSLAMHVMGGLSPDPDNRAGTPPWIDSVQPVRELKAAAVDPEDASALDATSESDSSGSLVKNVLGFAAGAARVAKLGPSTVRTLGEMYGDVNVRLPYAAPKTIFNVSVDGARRFAGDVWPYERLKRVAVAAGCTVNDVALAMCSGALRDYLLELEALPDESLIAMVPVSLRGGNAGYTPGEGNAFGSILCDLATNKADAAARLTVIHDCTKTSKDRLKSLSALEAGAVSGLVMGGVLLGAFTGLTSSARQPFNLTISNIPTSRERLYWNGAEMTELYPLAMLSEGQAINITVTQYVDKFAFGIVGCRHAVPHLQRLLVHLETALTDLEEATA